eukprot:gene4417-5007_t
MPPTLDYSEKMGDFKSRAEQAIQAGEQFCNLYYDHFDKKRHLLAKLYTDSSIFIWNGNPVKGSGSLMEFLTNLPATQHNILSLDCQPVSEIATPGQTTILVIVEGTVSCNEENPKYFSQNFMITALDNVWKIASDCFRFIDR